MTCRSAAAGASPATPTRLMERLVGGWQVGVSSIVNSGRLVDLGNVRVVGMTPEGRAEHLQAAVRRRRQAGLHVPAGRHRQHHPRLRGQRDVGVRLLRRRADRPLLRAGQRPGLHGERAEQSRQLRHRLAGRDRSAFQQHDIRISKRTAVVGHTNFEFAAEMLNAFNHPNFLPVNGIGSSTVSGYQLTAPAGHQPARASSRS